MAYRIKDLLIAGLAIGAATAALYVGISARSSKVNLDTYDVLGAVTAEETAKLLGNKGQVLVISRDTGPDKNPSVEAELAAFQQTLKKHPDLSLATEKIQLTPMLMMSTGGAVPPDKFFKALQSHAQAAAVVLFFAFPPLADSDLEGLKRLSVKVVVVSSLHPAYSRLLEEHAIHLAIVPRPEPPPSGTPAPRTVRERFDQEFAVLTPNDGHSP